MTRRGIYLPEAQYARMYEATVVSRIDLWLTDSSGKVALVERKSEPHADWWLPGGRFRPCHDMEPAEAAADCLRRNLDVSVGAELLRQVDLAHYLWGMPSFGITAQLMSVVWCVELDSVEVAGIRLSPKYRQLAWCDPIELAESQGVYHPALTRIARSALAHCRR